jgi:cytochrome c-type biogenesis protein CcmH
MKTLATLLLAALLAANAFAGVAQPLAQDPVVEQRMIAISEEVRCLVCQNESLAGSRAELAQDLRREIRGLIRQGKTDAEIFEFLVSRYGDFVRYSPPLKPSTWLLWFGPFLLLGAGGVMLLRRQRGTRARDEDQPVLDEAQRTEALRLLRQADTGARP